MKRLVFLIVVLAAMAVSASPASAQGNYVTMDYASLPKVPGCDWYPNQNYPGMYDAWCGSDEIGWYQPYQWYQLTGIYPPEYGMTGG